MTKNGFLAMPYGLQHLQVHWQPLPVMLTIAISSEERSSPKSVGGPPSLVILAKRNGAREFLRPE